MTCWPQSHSGALPAAWNSAFKPYLWIGNEERGLCWMSDSDENWCLSDPDRALEISKGKRESVVRLNLITTPTEVGPDQSLTYRFGIQATPVRPNPRTCWDIRYCNLLPYGYEAKGLDQRIGNRPVLDVHAEAGVRALYVSRWSRIFSYPLPYGNEREFRTFVSRIHDKDLQIVPYMIGFLLSEIAPEYRDFPLDMLVSPPRRFQLTNSPPGFQPQTCYYTCRRGACQDWSVAAAARCLDEYDVDGVYLDGTSMPVPCANEQHGCGYRSPDGRLHPTYPMFATRRFFKRLYAVVKSRKPAGVVDAHVGSFPFVPALSFATGYWHGEHLRKAEHTTNVLSLDQFRAEYMGHNLGVPAELLHYVLGDYDACTALALIHDVPVRPMNESMLRTISDLWRVRESFNCTDATFVGYWDATSPVKAETADCYASHWQRPDRQILVAVANLGHESATVPIRLDRVALGMTNPPRAENALTGDAIAVEADSFSVTLPSQRWALVWVR